MKLLSLMGVTSLLLGLVPYSLWSVIQIGETGDPANVLNNRLENTLLIFWIVLFAISVVLLAIKRFHKERDIHLCFFNKFNLLILLLILLSLFLNYE